MVARHQVRKGGGQGKLGQGCQPGFGRQRSVTLCNRQRLRLVDMRGLRRIVQALLRETWPDAGFDLAFYIVAAPEMTRLNETFLQHRGSTDVITFDYGAPALPHGEIFICLDEAVSQARRFHTTWQSELVRYMVHGVLHLLGHDDRLCRARRRMKEAEDARWLNWPAGLTFVA